MREMLGEPVRTGQKQDVSIGAKPEETMEGAGGKNCRNEEILMLNATCILLYPMSTPFLLLLLGGCRASQLRAYVVPWANRLSSLRLRYLIHVTRLISVPTFGIVEAVTSIVAGTVLRTGLPKCTLQFLIFHSFPGRGPRPTSYI